MLRFSVVLGCVVLLIVGSSLAIADDYTWDQTNDSFTPGHMGSVDYFTPFGQEFVPNLDCLEVIELWVGDSSGSGSEPPTLVVNVRADHIGGVAIGSSSVFALPDEYEGVAVFVFEAVSLVPGERYVLEVIRTSGGNAMVGSTGGTDSYPLGRIIRWGEPDEDTDMWFREGVFAQTAVREMTWGRLKQLFR